MRVIGAEIRISSVYALPTDQKALSVH